MNLSAELFDEVVTSLNAATATAQAAAPGYEDAGGVGQRRQAPRVGVRARVTLIPLTDRLASSAMSVPVRDLSPAGIGFLHAEKIDLDESFVVLLPQSAGGQIAMLCEVAYWQPLAPNLFAIGARFTRVLRHGAADSTSDARIEQRPPVARRVAS